MSFWKHFRLCKRADFLLASQAGVKVFSDSFILIANDNGLKSFRIGITVTKKVGNAVVRNYCKRKMRVISRNISENFLCGIDYVFILKKDFISKEFQTIIYNCRRKIEVLNKKVYARFSIQDN